MGAKKDKSNNKKRWWSVVFSHSNGENGKNKNTTPNTIGNDGTAVVRAQVEMSNVTENNVVEGRDTSNPYIVAERALSRLEAMVETNVAINQKSKQVLAFAKMINQAIK